MRAAVPSRSRRPRPRHPVRVEWRLTKGFKVPRVERGDHRLRLRSLPLRGLVRHRRCWAMIVSTSCAQVSRNVAIGGGTLRAICAINSSGIGPGPLGIADTSPTADAPYPIASFASSMLAMQQILIRG